ncbi:MAG: cell division protein SepF [Clostridiales bacterium]|jgi:cell division inhibitor SepF|nr:cell division protein SepF [Clostridiales bacterium]
MGLMDKIKGIVNPDHIDDNFDNDYDFEADDDDAYGYEGSDYMAQGPGPGAGYTQHPPHHTDAHGQQAQTGGVSINAAALELKVVKPERYDVQTAQKIADHLLNRRTVVLNLELTNKESARRLIDFLSGVAYSIDGYMQRVANNTFVIVPNNVDISGEQLQSPQTQRQINTDDLY